MPTTTTTTQYAPIGGSPHLDSSASGSPSQVRTPDEDSEDDGDGDGGGGGEEGYKLRALSGNGEGVSDEGREEGYSDDGGLTEKEGGEGERAKYARRRRVSVQSFELYTPDEERVVVRKFDRRLVGFLAGLYMLSFLDRSSKSSFRGVGIG